MPGVELSISSCDGHVAVAMRGELDASAEAASRLTISPAWPSGGLVRACATAEIPSPGMAPTAPLAPQTEGSTILQSHRYGRNGSELPGTLQRSCQEAQDIFTEAHDCAVQTYGEGDKADRAAFTALKEKFEKRGDHWITK